ncbi:MAG TPA: hypothetical protein VF572_06145 [Candidatus Saccharimonadales bacterium]|jgi:hypothetical protein
MATQQNIPITLDLEVQKQTVNVDIESIAPLYGFTAGSFDVANSTITATVNNTSGTEQRYRLVIHADVEAGTSATARIVSGDTKTFKQPAEFERITDKYADIIQPILTKLGSIPDQTLPKNKQLTAMAKQFKVADIDIPAGVHVLRIHVSQVVKPAVENPRQFMLEMYAPLLCFAPTPNVLLSATIVFPVDFQAVASTGPASYRSLPGMNDPRLTAGGNDQVQLARHPAYGWVFQNVDPIISVGWLYN